MSDPKRATLITVGAPKSEKNKVNKTVRLTINLDESNESKYPELNYKELVIAEERTIQRTHKVENGKTDGLNPFSDNDEDVERVARKFEQKYGGKSTYGRKGRSKHDDFADIGAGYDENDSFIDNTDGYDEMIPPECDTLYGGFYINSGSLEFKNVDPPASDDEGPRGRRNKRRISSSSSDEDSSESSSGSESAGEKPKPLLNGTASHHTEHRKKKNKKSDKKKAKKVRRTDSSAATSGKHTSDENVQGEASSADSRTSHSDSLTSKPAPSSENPATSDSSRDTEAKTEVKLPTEVELLLQELEALVQRPPAPAAPAAPHAPAGRSVESLADPHVFRLERALSACGAESVVRRAVWTRAARALRVSRTRLLQRARTLAGHTATPHAHTHTHTATRPNSTSQAATNTAPAPAAAAATASAPRQKRKADDDLKDFDPSTLTDDEKEAKIVETLQRLKALIDERKPSMIANYNAECERVQEERKKIQIASAAEGAPQGECNKRLPKRRFPWCPRTRALLTRLVKLSKDQESAGILLARRALPLFPSGFVRMPTLLRQADLNKEFKVTDLKRQRVNSSSQPYPQPTSVIQPTPSAAPTSTAGLTPTPPPAAFPEPIHFPSSLTVTTMKPSPDKMEIPVGTEEKDKTSAIFGNIYNILSLNKDLVEKQDDRKKDSKKDDSYIPPNNIGSITITPVPVPPNTQKPERKPSSSTNEKKPEGLIRIKSPAVLNEMVHKQEKVKAILENAHKRENETTHTQKDTKDKAKSSDVHKRDETSHKHEKSKALDNIHNRDITNISHRADRDRTSEVPNTHSHNKDTSESAHKYEKVKALENIHKRDKDKHKKEKSHRNHSSSSSRVDTPLHIDTNFQLKHKDPTPSPKAKDELVHKTIDNMRIDERNIPRPALIPVHHSPTFAKPDKRPPEVKKKKEVLIISDVDPLEPAEPVSVDDSSSDVEVVEDKSDQSENVTVPSNNKTLREVRKEHSKDGVQKDSDIEKLDEATKEDFDSVMKNLRDLEQHSQEAPKFNTSSYGGVITTAKRAQCAGEGRRAPALGPHRKDKLTNFFEQNGWL